MGNDIITAGVKINVSNGVSSRTSGSIKSNSDKYLKSIMGELKSGNRLADQIAKKALSGFGGAGGVASSGGLTAALVAGFAALTAASGAAEKPEGQFSMFQKAMVDGEDKVLEFDQLTGDVVDIITEREAEERGILTATGEVRAKYAITTKAIENNIGSLEKQRDSLIISSSLLESMSNEQVKQEFYDTEITKFKKQIAENLAKKASMSFSDASGSTTGIDTGSQSIDFSTTGGSNYAIEQNANDFFNTLKSQNSVDSIVSIQQESSQSTGSIYLDLLSSGGLFK